MGCDIHGHIIYTEEFESGGQFTSTFAKLNLGRNYSLFTALAGVRSSWGEAQFCGRPIGFPEKISWQLEDDLFLKVTDDESLMRLEGYVSKENAERFASMNRRHFHNGYKDETQKKVLHPDWHSHSYMDIEDLSAALRRYNGLIKSRGYEGGGAPAEMKAILASMRALKAGGVEPLFVFWFDN
jgi:hypothetical protein